MATYTVKVGDTLSRIARTFGTTVQALANVNHIPDPNVIDVGQQLTIPGPEAPAAPAPETTHVVTEGQNLTEIAREMGTTVPTLLADNPQITNPDLIYPGEVIVDTPPPPAPAAPATPEPVAGPATETYVVRSGDTLSAIAAHFGTNVDLIVTMNRIPNPDLIYPGQRLQIVSNLGNQNTLYDSVNAFAIPSGVEHVAGYIDGKYAWTDAEWSRFASAVTKLKITVLGSDAADVLDVEKYDATTADAAAWISRNPGKMIYCSASNVPAVKAALGSAPYRLWVADWTNEPHMYPGATITQWTSTPGYDVSEIA